MLRLAGPCVINALKPFSNLCRSPVLFRFFDGLNENLADDTPMPTRLRYPAGMFLQQYLCEVGRQLARGGARRPAQDLQGAPTYG